MKQQAQTAIQIRTVRYKKARVEHHFMANGVVQRFVVLEDERLRESLNQARRTRIDAIDLWSADAAMNRGDELERAVRFAGTHLRELYRKAAQARTARRTNAGGEKRVGRKRALGREIVPSTTTEDAVGTLLYAGMRPGIPCCIELFTADGTLLRIEGIDLPRALDVADAGVGDVIRVTKVAIHRVGITVQRNGWHGTGKRSRRHSRAVFRIVKEAGQCHTGEQCYPARHAPRNAARR